MTWLRWMIVILPMVAVLWAAFQSKRGVNDVADYFARGRVAGHVSLADKGRFEAVGETAEEGEPKPKA